MTMTDSAVATAPPTGAPARLGSATAAAAPPTGGVKAPAIPFHFLPFIAGSLGGLVSTALLQPLDVVRTRLQLPSTAGAGGSTAPRMGGMVSTFQTIIRNESVAGLWKGGAASTLRVGFGAGLYFGIQNWGLALARSFAPPAATATAATAGSGAGAAAAAASSQVSPSVTAAIGGGSRIIAAVICSPISVIKTRFEAAATRSEYNGVWHALRTISQREGVRGLYAGIGPTITRDAPYAALHLVFYTRVKAALSKAVGGDARIKASSDAAARAGGLASVVSVGPAVQFASGFVAGGAATAITHPFDVIKTRIQVERLSRLKAAAAASTPTAVGTTSAASAAAAAAAATAGASPVAYTTVKPEAVFGLRSLSALRAVLADSGPIGLTAGMLPRMLKRALSNAMTWTLYEQIVSAGKGKSHL